MLKRFLLLWLLAFPALSQTIGPGGGSLVSVTGITLSSSGFDSNLSNATVGSIQIAAAGGVFSGTLLLATHGGCPSTDNASFQIVGTTLETNGALLWSSSEGSYNVCVAANQGGTLYYQSFAISGIRTPGVSAALFAHPYQQCVTTKWVDGTAGNNANPGTEAQPWKTLQFVAAQIPGSGGGAGWCIKVRPDIYSETVSITNGGASATPTGWVLWQCTVMTQCVMDNPNGAFAILGHNNQGFFSWFDGFDFGSTSPGAEFGQALQVYNSDQQFVISTHHIGVSNSLVHGWGQSGLQFGQGDWFYAINNEIYNNGFEANACCQGSGISDFLPIALAGYSPTTDDSTNFVFGATNPTHNAFLYNRVYSNLIGTTNNASTSNHTDGNGIIIDTSTWLGQTSGVPYTGGFLVTNNAIYNNGGGGVHVFTSSNVIVANNTLYNNYIDPYNNGSFRAGTDDNGGGPGNTFINNIAVGLPNFANVCQALTAPYTMYTNSILGHPNGLPDYEPGSTLTTLNGAINSSVTSLVVTSAASFPAVAPFVVQIEAEKIFVGVRSGTTFSGLVRGYFGTTAATHIDTSNIALVTATAASNALVTTLNADIGDTDLTLTVTDALGFPPAPFVVGIDSEQIMVGAKSGTTFSSLTRGYQQTVPVPHSASTGASSSTGTTTGGSAYVIGISAVGSGNLGVGSSIAGTGIPRQTYITVEFTGFPSGTAGNYGTNNPTTASGATITGSNPVFLIPDYFSHNITQQQGGNTSCWGPFYAGNNLPQYVSGDVYAPPIQIGGTGDTYPLIENLLNTDPGWIGVGTTSPGFVYPPVAYPPQPTPLNFALKPGSKPIGYGMLKSYLPWWAVDAGAIPPQLGQWP